jgi:beta-1,2-mannobiose phosphorylase / 1,2-beta-oligomannan phosphorylase
MASRGGRPRAFTAPSGRCSDLDDPSRILRLEDQQPVLEANPELTRPIARQMYLPTPVVFTTGVADVGDHYIVASGEVDLACRITHMPKALFA